MSFLGKIGSKRHQKNSSDSRLKLYASNEPAKGRRPNIEPEECESEDEVMLSATEEFETVVPESRMAESVVDELPVEVEEEPEALLVATVESTELVEAVALEELPVEVEEPEMDESIGQADVVAVEDLEAEKGDPETVEEASEVVGQATGIRRVLPEGWVDVAEGEWSQEMLEAMDWKLFEQLCCEVLKRRKYQATLTANGPDGGIDMVAFGDGVVSGKGIAVQCKRYSHPVPAKVVREFFGAALRDGHERMIFITSHIYNERAKEEFGADSRIKLVDGQGLLRVIRSLGTDTEMELLNAIQRVESDWQTPTCPKCDVKMAYRVARRRGRRFWRCPNYSTENCMERIYLKNLP